MTVLLICAAAIALCASCGSEAETAATPTPPVAPAAEAAAPGAAREAGEAREARGAGGAGDAPEAAAASEAVLRELGFAALPGRLSRRQGRQVSAGLRLVNRGQHAEALERLGPVLESNADADTVRWGLVRAHVGAGDLDAARGLLPPLLMRDLPSYAGALRTDAALAGLRDGARGRALLARLDELDAAWVLARNEGIAAVLSRSGSTSDSEGMAVHAVDSFRGGVYVPSVERFFPLTPAEPDAITARVDLAAGTITYVTGSWSSIDDYGRADLFPRVFAEHAIYPGTTAPRRLPVFREDYSRPLTLADAGRVWHPVPTQAQYDDWMENGESDEPPVQRHWRTLAEGGLVRTSDQSAPTGPQITVDASGTVLTSEPPEDMRVRGNNLVVDGRDEAIEMGRGHGASGVRSVAVDSERNLVFVASGRRVVRGRCDDGGWTIGRHFVDRVSLTSGEVQRLSEGEEVAAVVMGSGGALYLQIGKSLRRYPDPSVDAFETVFEGVLLAALSHDAVCEEEDRNGGSY